MRFGELRNNAHLRGGAQWPNGRTVILPLPDNTPVLAVSLEPQGAWPKT